MGYIRNEFYQRDLRPDPEAAQRRADAIDAMNNRRTMSDHKTQLRDALAPIKSSLESLARDEASKKFTPEFFQPERKRLLAMAAQQERQVTQSFLDAQEVLKREAKAIRAKATVEVDQTRRLADMLEAAQLVASDTAAPVFFEQAIAMQQAEQPERAKFLLNVAKAKKLMPSQQTVDFEKAVDISLDLKDPNRREARVIEAGIDNAVAEYDIARLDLLVSTGVGLTEDGQAGSGSREDITRASIQSKVRKQRTATEAA